MAISAEIICVGSELLLGHIVNTNASYLARKLAAEGIDIFYQSVVGDNPGRLSEAVHTAFGRSDIIITTGGLGPTVDDVTINAIASALSVPLVFDEKVLRSIESHFKKRRIKMPPDNKRQAHIPKGATAILNLVGTAPASIIEYGKKSIIALPGPPRELIPIFENSVIPYLRKKYKRRAVIFTRTVRTAGAPESAVNKKVRRFLEMKGNVTVGIYASLGEVDIKITTKAKNESTALKKIRKAEVRIVSVLGDIVYGFDNDTLESVIGKILTKRHLTLATAESCTGGLIANRITNVPGSSRYFKMGVITYSNASKMVELGVPVDLIRKYGAVSRPVAVAMAKGIRAKAGTDFALAVTGIAGPTGGTKKKPVGLVYIALANRRKVVCLERRFIGNRFDVKLQVSIAALDILRKALGSDPRYVNYNG
ncbi:MAG: competence/damage-inducible protein A [Candidatus Omnitrophica bacterium]|nr:competence/damage-inducible protein A [Candidatus Omnitrophota bacterium]MBU4487608.1 competence/damage-inducible protein A [Candidatus Omnitrophota bacterium]MCG2705691.1 competence/damage-inducible protein A [Candidatus Omnitrophota bacterium]